MSDQLPVRAVSGIVPQNLTEVMTLSKVAQESNHFGVKNPAEAAVRIMYGQELGLTPIQSLMGVVVIQGKPTLAANTVAALIKRTGRYNYRVAKWDATACELEFTEGGKPLGPVSFSLDDARKAGLIKQGGGWDKYPKAMLFARAVTQGARTYCPDVFLGGIYTPDELEEPEIQAPVVTAKPDKIAVAAAKTATALATNEHPLRAWLNEKFGTDQAGKKAAMETVYGEVSKMGMTESKATDDLTQWRQLKQLFDNQHIDLQFCEDCLTPLDDEPIDYQDDGLHGNH